MIRESLEEEKSISPDHMVQKKFKLNSGCRGNTHKNLLVSDKMGSLQGNNNANLIISDN